MRCNVISEKATSRVAGSVAVLSGSWCLVVVCMAEHMAGMLPDSK